MRRFVAACSVVLISIVLLAACGGGSDKANSPLDSIGATSPSGSSGNATSEIARLYGDAPKQKFKITFTTGGEESTTYAQDGNGRIMWRTGSSQTFISPTATVNCDTVSGNATCLSSAAGGTTNPFVEYYNAARTYVNELAAYGDKSSKTIAGRHADCVTISAAAVANKAGPAVAAIAAAIKGSLEYCVDKSTGVLLEATTTDASGKETKAFEVTKYEEPSDSDFTPPATHGSTPSYTIPGGG